MVVVAAVTALDVAFVSSFAALLAAVIGPIVTLVVSKRAARHDHEIRAKTDSHELEMRTRTDHHELEMRTKADRHELDMRIYDDRRDAYVIALREFYGYRNHAIKVLGALQDGTDLPPRHEDEEALHERLALMGAFAPEPIMEALSPVTAVYDAIQVAVRKAEEAGSPPRKKHVADELAGLLEDAGKALTDLRHRIREDLTGS